MVEDRFNKLGVFIPCKKVIKGHEAVKLLFVDVWIHFGLISSTMFDRAPRFGLVLDNIAGGWIQSSSIPLFFIFKPIGRLKCEQKMGPIFARI